MNGTDGGRRSLGDVITAADTGDISLLKSIQGVAEGILPEIQSVVICHCDDIYAQVLEDADVFWICAESKLFVWHRFSPQAERKFFVQQKQIRILHVGQHAAVGDGPGSRPRHRRTDNDPET